MSLFYGEFQNGVAKLTSEETHHLAKVLRHSVGDKIQVSDGKGSLANGTIESISKKETIIQISDFAEFESPKRKVGLVIAPPKSNDRWEFILEKATEIGVWSIHPIITYHSERKRINLERSKKIITSAAKQSLKVFVPSIFEPIDFSKFIKENKGYETFIFHCNANFPRVNFRDSEYSTLDDFKILVGPEGDFSELEIDQANQNNIKALHLGQNRLRTETAAILALWESLRLS